MNVYKSHWTAEKLKMFRKEFLLNQTNLALLLGTPQQRISEWEVGMHSMKQAYTRLMDNLKERLVAILRQALEDEAEYRRLVMKSFGVELKGTSGRHGD